MSTVQPLWLCDDLAFVWPNHGFVCALRMQHIDRIDYQGFERIQFITLMQNARKNIEEMFTSEATRPAQTMKALMTCDLTRLHMSGPVYSAVSCRGCVPACYVFAHHAQ
jgi:hypothetical protein